MPVWLWLRRGVFTCVGWKVTLCDPTWQVTLHYIAMRWSFISSYTVYTTFTFYLCLCVCVCGSMR